jgi:hypothetical protein
VTLTVEEEYAAHFTNASPQVRLTADLLRDVCDVGFDSPGSNLSTYVKNSDLRAIALADILRAFDIVFHYYDSHDFDGVHHVVRAALDEFGTPQQILAAIIEVQDEFPTRIAYLVDATLGDKSSLRSLTRTNLLFGLHADVYKELGLDVPHAAYRQSRVDNACSTLTSPQCALAAVLCADWQGSLDSLVQTVHTLCPDTPTANAPST